MAQLYVNLETHATHSDNKCGVICGAGEIIRPARCAAGLRRRANLRSEAAMQHHDLLSRTVSTDRDITLEALRVFTYLSRRLHFDRPVPVLQSELADALGMQRPNVNRAIKLLETKQILLRDSKLGRAITFRLNPELEGGRA
ncbi:MarR family transcriptional regulator [Azospirillum argentinense]|nr:MarR family transcriptional regulator [Azospirillum argentinense]